jgi:hypothetical protein
MRALTPADILDLWEAGVDQHPLDRALTLLAAAGEGPRRDDLARLSIGERDRRLWELRERTIGPDVEGLARCPACGEGVAVQFLVSDVRVRADDPSGREFDLDAGDWSVRFRLPDSRDLAAVVVAGDGQAELAARCLVHATRDGRGVTVAEVPVEAWDLLQRRMSELDPQAELRLELACPACGHRWLTLFDIAGFFWAELATLARRLMREVDVLARAYGWSEAEILRLGPARRRAYLELACS